MKSGEVQDQLLLLLARQAALMTRIRFSFESFFADAHPRFFQRLMLDKLTSKS
jgi:hypothetical protein